MRETSLQLVTNNQDNNKECRMKGNGYCPKPLERVAVFLIKKWTLSIIVTIGNFNTIRFNDLLKRIEGMTQKTLSERLRELEKRNIVVRHAFSERPPRVEYSLTSSGQKIMKAVLPLLKLAESNALLNKVQ